MSLRYFRYTFEEALTPREAAFMASAARGVLVRVDTRESRTQITLATLQDAAIIEGFPAKPVELSEKELLDAGKLTS